MLMAFLQTRNGFDAGRVYELEAGEHLIDVGKGNAMYKCKLRNLLRNTVISRTYKGGESLESADVEEIDVQFLYKQADTFVFMESTTYEQ